MELNENAKLGQSGIGKEQYITTPLIPVGGAWDFMNLGMQVGYNPEIGMPHPPD